MTMLPPIAELRVQLRTQLATGAHEALLADVQARMGKSAAACVFVASTLCLAQYSGPESVEYDAAGDRYLVSNTGSSSIKQRDQLGTVTNFATGLSDDQRVHYMQPKVGHYGVFNGSRFRSEIAPRIVDFMASHDSKRAKAPPRLKVLQK